MHFCDSLSRRFDMFVSMSHKELKRLSVLQEICDQHVTQAQAAPLLYISQCKIGVHCKKYKAQSPATLAHTGRVKLSIPDSVSDKLSTVHNRSLINF